MFHSLIICLSPIIGYHAPIDVLMELHRMETDDTPSNGEIINVCFGKEWYRFPSSFFLPSDRYAEMNRYPPRVVSTSNKAVMQPVKLGIFVITNIT